MSRNVDAQEVCEMKKLELSSVCFIGSALCALAIYLWIFLTAPWQLYVSITGITLFVAAISLQ